MNKNNDSLSGLIFLVLCGILASNILVFISFREQQSIIQDTKYLVPKLPLSEAESFNYNYPTLNVFTMPLKNYLGRVYLREGKYDKAIETLHQARKENPYLMANESFLADVYRNLKMDDSVKFYSRKSFYNMPNNAMHFENFLTSIDLNDTLTLDKGFEMINKKSNKIWLAYLAGMVQLNVKSKAMLENIQYAKKTFYDIPAARLLIDYIEYGRENVDRAIDYSEKAKEQMSKNDYENALVNLQLAYEITPNNSDILDNLAACYYFLGDFEKANKYVEEINENHVSNNGRYLFIRGIILGELQRFEEACKFLTDAIKLNFNEAYKAKLKYCGK